ncbi:sensor histidine kinase [Acetivibrio mesophilus]|uniref:Heme sensor protein HssS n=1 Tax=Acetivibrio mesophilus TaxID=2487273 RepID=A0A4Q0I2D7_9FIRM|nr:HAMP domain-containing sensor histidine kinase [Acetivibrio mesophilus]ODM27932.1 two-component sensor histidine kinase [Clostridium sp. Bc-iso-3]RXE58368.1 sensor histidine kinase [Acetivibrio mesophilus]HHV28208.1 HAMP domain-containing histidine kinase [Clostridium sp.]
MNRGRTLNIQMVFLVFYIMISSGVLTGVFFLFLFAIGILPIPRLAPILYPLVALLVSSIIGTSISAVASERVLKPLNQLIKATKVVATGDFSVRVEEINGHSEVGNLIKNFNHMVEELGSIEMFRNGFINDFSHEFKTPIVSIRGFAKQLQNDNLSPEKRKEYTDIIISESERLANMSANVLLLNKFENQQIITNKTEYELDEQIRDCVILLEKQWSKKNIEINLDLEPIKIYSNQEMLSHLFINLIENAIKYTNDNGHISICCHEAVDGIQFKISDDGNGMDENTKKRIFDKFFQGDKSHAVKGNGLGLSIVKRIVELCKGDIVVESEISKGTTFIVKLPKS